MRTRNQAVFVVLAVLAASLAVAASALAAIQLAVDSPPAINGRAQQGFALHETHASYSYAGSPVKPQAFTYQWQRCDTGGNSCVAITGATSRDYALTSIDVGHTIRVQERGSYVPPGQTTPVTASSRSKATAVVTPPGGPNVSATTQPATGITTNSATLHGLVNTSGASVTWQFQFGQSTNYNKGTPIQTIMAGKTSPVAVSWNLIHLTPNTLYHFRLVATFVSGGKSTTTAGPDLTFTTNSIGRLGLRSKKLSVTNGFVFVPLKCASSLKCVSEFTITANAHVKTGGTGTVVCAVKVARLNAGQIKTVKGKVSSACLGLLSAASNHQLKAKLTSRPRTGQRGLIRKVTLFLK